MRSSLVRCGWIASLMLVVFVGCSDTKTVFVERPLFDEPPANAAGFLGYGTEADRTAGVAVCGQCHSGKQRDWVTTGHADAWATLQDSGHGQEFCEGCHAVSENGNATSTPGGWTATADARYEDVQCESCHGPGDAHVNAPGASQPMASIAVGTDVTTGCGECHSGSHHPFLEEWSQSRHGYAGNEGVRGRGSCQSCHEGRGALVALGVNTSYAEQGGSTDQPITCAVCHDPHGSPNEANLRYPIDVTNVEQNLCMKCHQKRAVPELTNSRGPHSPQGPLLLGEDAGWIPPNFDTSIVRGTHGSDQNSELCATCHVNDYTITDPVTGEFTFHATGHLFKAIPCVDAQGIPTADESCAFTERTFASCSDCHDETTARTLYTVATNRIASDVAQLAAQLAGVPSSEFDPDDDVLTVAEGALFNQKLGEITSSAIHNPFLTEALLLGSMQAVQAEYGIAPSISPAEIARRLREISVSGQ